MSFHSLQNPSWSKRSHTWRVAALAIVALALQYPVWEVKRLTDERQTAQVQATQEVQQMWGHGQDMAGPVLVVPYERVRPASGDTAPSVEKHFVVLLPETLDVNAELKHEFRERGAFRVPLYQADVRMRAAFHAIDRVLHFPNADDVLWDEASLIMLVSDARAVRQATATALDGQELVIEPGIAAKGFTANGYQILLTGIDPEHAMTFEIHLHLNGSNALRFSPIGRESVLTLQSDWPTPSFQGKWLPVERSVTENGFRATWTVPYLARGFSQSRFTPDGFVTVAKGAAVGVDFISPVDPYRLTDRSGKYSLLFIGLTFAVIWLFEVLFGLRVHIIQYLFTGAALCLFYLLLLSFSEHLGFLRAYGIAAVSVAAMATAYARVMLQRWRRSLVVGAGVAGLYAYLFALLQEQDYALLAGSIGLFAMLGALMFLTRRVQWHKPEEGIPIAGETGNAVADRVLQGGPS